MGFSELDLGLYWCNWVLVRSPISPQPLIFGYSTSRHPHAATGNELMNNFSKSWGSITPEMCFYYCGNYDKFLLVRKKSN